MLTGVDRAKVYTLLYATQGFAHHISMLVMRSRCAAKEKEDRTYPAINDSEPPPKRQRVGAERESDAAESVEATKRMSFVPTLQTEIVPIVCAAHFALISIQLPLLQSSKCQ